MHISRIAIAPAAAVIALLLASCGGAHTTSTTSASSPGSGVQGAYKFSECMRQHGVSNFPNPIVHSSPGHQSIGIAVNPTITGSPAFKSAQKACHELLPGPPSPAQQAAQEHYREVHLLAFAECMRGHGINGFPDPNPQGQITRNMLKSAGTNIELPNVIAAARACVPASGGLLTRAAISQATGGGSSSGSGG